MLQIVFLGILPDGEHLVLSIPIEKRTKAIYLLKWTLDKKTVMIKHIQKLTGTLNFLNRAIFAGRAFMRRMYQRLCGIHTDSKLRAYHHMRLDKGFKKDCKVWLEFLQQPERISLCRPFVDLSVFDTAETLQFFTDSSANPELSFGCVFGTRWIFGKWETGFVHKFNPSIEYLELVALVIGVLSWGHLLTKKRMIICDNQAVVQMVNNMSSKCSHSMELIRLLVTDGLIYNRRVFVKYIRSKDNILADWLSRLKFNTFHKFGPNMRLEPDKISDRVWPISKFWE